MGDVENHGPVSAADALRIQAEMEAEHFQAKMKLPQNGADILLDLESQDLLGFRLIMSMGLFRLFDGGRIEYSSAGADALYIIRENGVVESLSRSGGAFIRGSSFYAETKEAEEAAHLNPGDYVLLFTDGVGESIIPSLGIQFATLLRSPEHSAFREVLVDQMRKTPRVDQIPELIISMLDMKRAHPNDNDANVPDGQYRDDATLLVMKMRSDFSSSDSAARRGN